MSTAASDVRVVTTLGHVDHGKTTFTDALLAANNIISTRMAGKIRYLDSRDDEQQRGITMESSAVSLKFKVMDKTHEVDGPPHVYTVNLIDTPGHVDFSSEVSTASRLCDGGLVLVDVVEGTIAVLRQAWIDHLRPILVINKIDRLITELKLAPIEAYHHLSQLIEQVNAVMGGFFAGERMEDDLRWREEREKRLAEKRDSHADEAEATTTEPQDFEEKDDEDIYFAPQTGNVIFASAIDGWGFRIGKFAQLYAQKLGMKENNLRRVLWGDFYLDPKTKRVISHKQLRGRALKPLFVQFVLENIWAVYENVITNPNPDKVAKIVSILGLKILPRDLKSKDTRNLLSLVFGQWLSLSTCTIQAIIDVVPPPSIAQRSRIPKILYPDLHDTLVEPKGKLQSDLFSCNVSPDAFVVAYVSKMFAVSRNDLPGKKKLAATAEEMRSRGRAAGEEQTTTDMATTGDGGADNSPQPPEEEKQDEKSLEGQDVLLGFARLYSGSIRMGTRIACVLPKFSTGLGPVDVRNAKHLVGANVEALYVMMGRELVSVDAVHAGNIFAVKGLEGKVWRSATLCSPNERGVGEVATFDQPGIKESLINLGSVSQATAPIVRVAVEPTEPANLPKLLAGLKLLSQADPCVETFQQRTGEHVILTAGELHLERCVKDLRERFAKVDIQVSKPIVPFRETAVRAPDMPPTRTPNAARGTIHGTTPFNMVSFTIRAAPLPLNLLVFLQHNQSIMKRFRRETQATGVIDGSESDQQGGFDEEAFIQGEVVRKPTVRPEDFWPALEDECVKAGSEWVGITKRIWAFGPQSAGTCILVDSRHASHNSLFSKIAHSYKQKPHVEPDKRDNHNETYRMREFEHSIEAGFQMATLQGPLCSEPVEGICYFLENMNVDQAVIEQEAGRFSQVCGSLISVMRDACRQALLDWSPRLMLAMYSCDIQASTEVLGKVYGVVAKRRGRIVAEEVKEGSTYFTVQALLPVIESFGFADDIRKRTSGAASPQLIFNGYDMLDLDPFWIPTTEEELEDLGEKADRDNMAKAYMDAVRQRKGLFVDRKIVEFAEKQRTLKR